MALINLTYKGLVGEIGTLTGVDDTITIDDLITLIASAEGLPTVYYSISKIDDPEVNDITFGDSTSSLATIGIINGDFILCTTNQYGTKEERQIQKLEIAQKKRQAGGDTNKPYYRTLNTYDTTLLPDTYNGNEPGPDDNPNVGGLQQGRPWI